MFTQCTANVLLGDMRLLGKTTTASTIFQIKLVNKNYTQKLKTSSDNVIWNHMHSLRINSTRIPALILWLLFISEVFKPGILARDVSLQ